MTDILPELKLHRARASIDAEIERYTKMIDPGSEWYLKGVVFGLQKARLTIMTNEELSDTAQMRREMFG